MNLKQKLLLSVSLLITGMTIWKLLEFIYLPNYIAGLFLLEFYSINILGIIIATILWEGIRTYSSLLQNLIKAEKFQMVHHLAASISQRVGTPLQ